MLPLFTTLAVGVVAGFILLKLKVPGGMMVGSIIGVSCLTLFTGLGAMPYAAKLAAQMAAGAFIGCSVEREDLSRLRYIYKPAAAMLLALLVLNLIMGFVIYAITPAGIWRHRLALRLPGESARCPSSPWTWCGCGQGGGDACLPAWWWGGLFSGLYRVDQ